MTKDVIIRLSDSGYCALSQQKGFLQQCSPYYIYKKCLTKWCKKHGYNIVKAFDQNYKISKFISELKQAHNDDNLLNLAYEYGFKWFKNTTVSKIDGMPKNGMFATNDKFIVYKLSNATNDNFDVVLVKVFDYTTSINNDF